MPQTPTAASNLVGQNVGANAATNANIGPGPTGTIVWLCGIAINGTGPTPATTAQTATITGLAVGTLNIAIPQPVAGQVSVIITFNPPIPGLVNNAVALNVPAFGTGSINQSSLLWGFAAPA